MHSFEKLLLQMNTLLDQLVEVARKLRDASQHDVSEEELSPLQLQQEKLLFQLEEIDQLLKKENPSHLNSKNEERIYEKLEEFQSLNREFVERFKSNRGLIKFDLRQFEKDS